MERTDGKDNRKKDGKDNREIQESVGNFAFFLSLNVTYLINSREDNNDISRINYIK